MVREVTELRHIRISHRSQCDLEVLATGGFSPLDRFMGSRDYQWVLHERLLANGLPFTIPSTLPIAQNCHRCTRGRLRSSTGMAERSCGDAVAADASGQALDPVWQLATGTKVGFPADHVQHCVWKVPS